MNNKGSCQCGAIAFKFEGPSFLTFCHCRICQKLHGSAFAPILHAESKTFKWLKGEEFLSYFNSSPQLKRADTLHYDTIPEGGIREVYERVLSMSQKI